MRAEVDSRPRMGLAHQFGLLLALLIALSLGVYGLTSHQRRHQLLLNEASAELRNHASLVEAAVGGAVERGEVQLLKQRFEGAAGRGRKSPPAHSAKASGGGTPEEVPR